MISETSVEVRYAETDQMGVVYHANYVTWLDIARGKFFSDAGFSIVECENAGVIFPVRNVDVTYLKPCKFGETITIKTKIKQYRDISTVYTHEIIGGDGVLRAKAQTSVVCVDSSTFKAVKLSKHAPSVHAGYLKISRGEQ